MHFFRIVLDEAHIIRTRQTQIFTATTKLAAVHHWCLTGTPISNKIDDLYSLLNFCRVPLLGDLLVFREHVATLSRKNFWRGCRILRDALRPICLRRNKDIIGLTDPEAVEISVQLSSSESKHYRQIIEAGRRAIDAAVGGRTGKSTRNVMLRILLELRIFCSQGTFRQDGLIYAEQKLDPDELFTLLEESEDASCASCRAEIAGVNQVDDESSGVLGTCSHVLCATCYNERASDGTPKECPICKQSFEAQDNNLGGNTINTSSAAAKHSSKLDALVQNLLVSQNAQAPEKSIVFSYWRKTIDLAADLCSQSGIRAVVVHGKTPHHERTKILEQLGEDPTISALLMTIGTGGLGLTINAASRVYIWSRNGILPYIVKDSVERHIQGYQKRKKALAASGFGHRSDHTSAEETVRLNAAYIA
ncbi:unnamed protein product [Cercospora beticola]|nr:unnamed protein product [Cercospora beticola]